MELLIDVEAIRKDFPILEQQVYGKPLVYLDNAATTQKPQVVIDALVQYYTRQNSNIHRGVHYLSQQATLAYEETREHVRRFINAPHNHEIIFTRGTTDAINLVAHAYGTKFIGPGDEVIVTAMEHHSNIVPWQIICKQQGASIKVIPMNESGELDLEAYAALLGPKTRMVALAQVSNALGTINPLKEIIQMAHQNNTPVLVDGAQGIAHLETDVQDLDCDFYCFSGHKMYAPMGIGVLYGKTQWLEAMPPYQGGGEMIKTVTFEETTYNELPFKFEPGTPNVAEVYGLNAALSYLEKTGRQAIIGYEDELLHYATDKLAQLPGIRFIGTAGKKTGLISFLMDGIHPYDAGTIVDKLGIAIRTGHHCAQPVMDFYRIPGTMRASFGLYNTFQDVDRLVQALKTVREMFG